MKTAFNKKNQATQTITIGSDPVLEPNINTPDNVGQLPLDVLENKKEIRVIAPLAGVDIDAVEIIINGDVLTIKGERMLDQELSELRGVDAYVQECYWGDFSRSIILPLHADTSQIEATQKNHILYIRIPKKPLVQMRIVKIKSK